MGECDILAQDRHKIRHNAVTGSGCGAFLW
uniref:Uncharacterized protein n=1 Tax=Anguilla anguilla TaxID=7936 RepID=A0A0E9U5Q2_ANGAN